MYIRHRRIPIGPAVWNGGRERRKVSYCSDFSNTRKVKRNGILSNGLLLRASGSSSKVLDPFLVQRRPVFAEDYDGIECGFATAGGNAAAWLYGLKFQDSTLAAV